MANKNRIKVLVFIKTLFIMAIASAVWFGCYGNCKLPLTCMGKIENLHFLLCHCRYFDKLLLKCFSSNLLSTTESFS